MPDPRTAEERLRAALTGLDGAFLWLTDNYPKAMNEMPTRHFRAFDAARAALAAEPVPVTEVDAACGAHAPTYFDGCYECARVREDAAEPVPVPLERAVYCTGGCDACRDYARKLGVPLIVPPIRQSPSIDVERLGEAIFRVGISRWRDERADPLPWAMEHQQEWARWLGQAQAAIAAEYARLAPPRRTPID